MESLSQTIIKGFKTCRLYPFDPFAVDYNVFDKKNKGGEEVSRRNGSGGEVITKQNEGTMSHLLFFENQLNHDTLSSFKTAFVSGKSEIEETNNQSLYMVWTKMKELSGEKLNKSTKN